MARYSSLRKLRGGFIPSSRMGTFSRGVRTVGRSIADNGIRNISSGFNKTIKNRYPKAYKAFTSFTGTTPADFAKTLFLKHIGNTGASIPGTGVIVRPGTRSKYFGIKNKGTGITTSKYTTGTVTALPKSVNVNALKMHYVLSDVAENFNIQNVSSIATGSAEHLLLTCGQLSTMAGQIPSSTLGTTDLSSMYLSSVKSVITLTSATNLNCKLRIYECVSKKDTNISNYKTPISAWSSGLDATNGTANSNTYTLIGMYPSMSPFFRDFWHVDAYYDIELAAGTSHQHKSTYNINTTVPFSWFRNHGPTSVTAGLTRAYLFVLSSSPVHDSTDETLVRMGVASVDINIVQTFEFYGIPNTEEVLTSSITGDAVTSDRVVTQADFIESTIVN